MEVVLGKTVLIGCCVWAVFVVYRIAVNLLAHRQSTPPSLGKGKKLRNPSGSIHPE